MDIIEMLARRTAPPGTQFDLFDNVASRRAAAQAAQGAATIPGPTLQQVVADPAQTALALRGKNPLMNTSVPVQRLRVPQSLLETTNLGRAQKELLAGQPRIQATAPVAEAPGMPQFADAAQGDLQLSGANPRPPLRGPRAPVQTAMPRFALDGPPAPQQTAAMRVPLSGPLAPQQTVNPRGPLVPAAPTDKIADIAKDLAGKTSRFPRLAKVLSGAGVGPVMPLSLKEITDVSMGGRNPEQDAAMENIRAAGAGVAEAWQQKGLDPTVKALFQGAKRIAFGAPGAAATPVVSAAPDTSPMREGTLQELLATPAPGAAAVATPQAAAAQAAPTNLLSQMEQVARAYPNMNLRQLIALTNALPATNGAGAAAAAPSRGTALAAERVVASIDQEWKSIMADPTLTPTQKRAEDRRLRQEWAQLVNVQAGLYNPSPEE